MEKIHRKPNLYEINHLRLNKAKGSWTWLADVYGLALCLLALSGLLMIWGKQKKAMHLSYGFGFSHSPPSTCSTRHR
jgi:hypothetical protein